MAGISRAKFPEPSETKKRSQSKHTRHWEKFNKSHTHTHKYTVKLYTETWHTAVTSKWLGVNLGTTLVCPTVHLQLVLTWPISDSTAVWIFQAGGGRNRGCLAHLRLGGEKWGWTSGSLWASQPVNRANKSTRGARWSKNRSRWFPFWTSGGGHVWAQCCI